MFSSKCQGSLEGIVLLCLAFYRTTVGLVAVCALPVCPLQQLRFFAEMMFFPYLTSQPFFRFCCNDQIRKYHFKSESNSSKTSSAGVYFSLHLGAFD